MFPSVFISYSHKDVAFARQFVSDLRSRIGFVWFDEHNIDAGSLWDDEIEKGIRVSDALIVLLSPTSVVSQNVKDEIDYADRLGLPIIPILIAECSDNIPLRIARRQWIDFRADYHAGLMNLLKALEKVGDFKLPQAQTCPVCGQVSESETICPFCKSIYRPTNIGDMYGLSPIAIQGYLSTYKSRVALPNASSEDLLVMGIAQLLLGVFDEARTLFERLVATIPTSSYGWYVLALAQLHSKRPRLLSRDEALRIQECAIKSIQYDAQQAHVALLLAIIKSDYFESNGFRIDPPSIRECLALARQGETTTNEFKALLALAPIPDGQLLNAMRQIVDLI